MRRFFPRPDEHSRDERPAAPRPPAERAPTAARAESRPPAAPSSPPPAARSRDAKHPPRERRADPRREVVYSTGPEPIDAANVAGGGFGAGGSHESGVAREPREKSGTREIPICGYAAVKALFTARPAAIKRLFFDAIQGRRVGVMSGYLAGQRRVYRQVTPEELEKIAGTVHHGGVVAIIDEAPPRAPSAEDIARWAKAGADVVVLDRIGNAHNLGAIARTLAFFGVPHLVVSADERAARPGESTYRVAEGGLEHVTVWSAPSLAALCRDLRAAGFAVVGADVRGKHLKGLRRREFTGKTGAPAPAGKHAAPAEPAAAKSASPAPAKSPAAGKPGAPQPLALILGNEEAGLAPEVVQACDRLVQIPGSGKMESLNVSAATAVLVAALRFAD